MEKCRHCGGQMAPIVHHGTLARSDVCWCGHCDRGCNRPRCPTCTKMLKTVRIIPGEP